MTREDTLDLLSVLKAAYPNFYRGMTVKDADHVVDLWFEMFKDDPVEVVAVAVKGHIATDTKGFPPHIGAIKDAIVKLRQPDEMTEIEAWHIVRKACRVHPWDAKEEYEKLPPVLQRLVGSPSQLQEWAKMDEDVVASVVASNFQRSYKARAAKEREYLALPSDVRELSAKLAAGMAALPGLPEADFEQKRVENMQRVIGYENRPD